MKDYEFLDAVGGIDKRFIEKAECATAKRPVWNYVMPVAACLVVMIGVYFAYPKLSPAQAPTYVPAPNPNGPAARRWPAGRRWDIRFFQSTSGR